MAAPLKKAPDNFPKEVHDREKRRQKSLKRGKQVWFGLGLFGLVGWSIAVPAVAGIFIGLWLDSNVSGKYSWSLMLFIAGLCLGCYNAWYWVQKEQNSISGKDNKNDH